MAKWTKQLLAAQVAQVRFPWSVNQQHSDYFLGIRWLEKMKPGMMKRYFLAFPECRKCCNSHAIYIGCSLSARFSDKWKFIYFCHRRQDLFQHNDNVDRLRHCALLLTVVFSRGEQVSGRNTSELPFAFSRLNELLHSDHSNEKIWTTEPGKVRLSLSRVISWAI